MAAAKKTTYVVLHSLNGADWRIDGPHQQAHSSDAAVRQAAALRVESNVDAAGSYVAVPASSWKPQTITVETQTRIILDTPTPT